MAREANKGSFGNRESKGKPKGVENKVTKQSKELFVQILEGEVQHIQQAFAEVRQDDPSKYLDLFAKYAKYFVPAQVKIDNPIEFTIRKFEIKSND